MKHEFNLLIQIDLFLSENFPGMKSSYMVKKHYGANCARVFRLLKQVEACIRSGELLKELQK